MPGSSVMQGSKFMLTGINEWAEPCDWAPIAMKLQHIWQTKSAGHPPYPIKRNTRNWDDKVGLRNAIRHGMRQKSRENSRLANPGH